MCMRGCKDKRSDILKRLIRRKLRFSHWHKYSCGDARDHTWAIYVIEVIRPGQNLNIPRDLDHFTRPFPREVTRGTKTTFSLRGSRSPLNIHSRGVVCSTTRLVALNRPVVFTYLLLPQFVFSTLSLHLLPLIRLSRCSDDFVTLISKHTRVETPETRAKMRISIFVYPRKLIFF